MVQETGALLRYSGCGLYSNSAVLALITPHGSETEKKQAQ